MDMTKCVKISFKSPAELNDLYRLMQVDYPRFFKMDNLSKIGFLASEHLLKDEQNRFEPTENVSIIGFNCYTSLDMDMKYQETIEDNDNYYPSPSLFVYTLPNIVLGEIALRNKYLGETNFYICEKFDAKQIVNTVKNTFHDKTTTIVICAWIEFFMQDMQVMMIKIEREDVDNEFTENFLIDFFNK
jgi:3-oxoacyl-[acyl-carrier-protein] synthase-1